MEPDDSAPIRRFLLEKSRELGYSVGTAPLYCPAWVEAFLEAVNHSWSAAYRELRAARLAESRGGRPMRIRIEVVGHDGHDEPSDWAEVYGWRAALACARAMRAELQRCYPVPHMHEWAYRRFVFRAVDARLLDAIDEYG